MLKEMKTDIYIIGMIILLVAAAVFRLITGISWDGDGYSAGAIGEKIGQAADEGINERRSDQHTVTARDVPPMPRLLKKVIPEQFMPVAKTEPFLHWELRGANGEFQGIAVQSVSVAPNAGSSYSYSGRPVNLGMVFSPEGSVAACVLLSSHDTNEYKAIVRSSGFLDSFKGKTSKQLKDVDAVSGATMTSGSLCEAAYAAAEIVGGYLADLKQGIRPEHRQDVTRPVSDSQGPAAVKRDDIRGISRRAAERKNLSMKEARFYTKLRNRRITCGLCPFRCVLAPGERGLCRVRGNVDGTLMTLVYGRVLAYHVDPIEKKPLYHFLPSSRAYSVATAGCNLRCIFCQNYTLSQAYPEDVELTYKKATQRDLDMGRPAVILSPEYTVEQALRKGCNSIAYTYSEPSVFYEYMIDTARYARKKGLRNVWVTCGYINTEPLKELCKYIDGANVDLKGYSQEYYRKYCGGDLNTVLNTLKTLKKEGVYFEITNLIVPGGNDDPEMICDMCTWITDNLGRNIPLHFSRFYPQYKMSGAQPTPPETLRMAARIAKKAGIRHVYLGNLRTGEGEDTFCPKCGRKIIDRWGYYIRDIAVKNGTCAFCGHPIHGVWK